MRTEHWTLPPPPPDSSHHCIELRHVEIKSWLIRAQAQAIHTKIRLFGHGPRALHDAAAAIAADDDDEASA